MLKKIKMSELKDPEDYYIVLQDQILKYCNTE